MLPQVFTPSYLRQLEMLTLNSRRAFLGLRQGTHLSAKRGQGIEFFDYRKYELGDNPRHIDWGLYGRSEKLYVKRFREEQALSALMLIDSSPSMTVTGDSSENSKWDVARDLALSLSYVALMKQDTVYLALTSGGAIPRFSGASGIHRAATFLSAAQHSQPKSVAREVMRVSSRVKFPGVAIIYSDLLFAFEDIEQSINILLAKNLDVSVVRMVSPLERDPFQGIQNALAIDSETGEQLEMDVHSGLLETYQRRLTEHIDTVRRFLGFRGVRLIEVSTERPLSDVIVRDLVKAGVVQ